MRRHLLPSLLILCLAGGIALAQTITRALQLSPDTTGAFSVDTNNGVYFPGHILSTGAAPTLTSCGTAPSIVGTDTAGQVQMGSANPTGCTVTFARPYVTAPSCTVTGQTSPATSPIAYTLATTGINVTVSGTIKFNYSGCTSAS